MANKVSTLMKKYCEHLFESEEPEAIAMYQALLPAVIRCEMAVGDSIECATEDLVHEFATFIRTELDIDIVQRLDSVVEETIEFIIKALLERRVA